MRELPAKRKEFKIEKDSWDKFMDRTEQNTKQSLHKGDFMMADKRIEENYQSQRTMLPTYSTLITPKVNVTGCTKKSYT
jgi:hypothetical protein